MKNPQAYVTKGKNRVKQIDTFVYLRDNDEFELELFNPKTFPVLAKIKLNGEFISDRGIVINPGQRVFLDRYIDEARKFKFSTYEINGNDSDAQQAIIDNGLVEILFYAKATVPKSNPYIITVGGYATAMGSSGTGGAEYPWYSCAGTPKDRLRDGIVGNIGIGQCSSTISYYSNTTNNINTQEWQMSMDLNDQESPMVETGRVEAGRRSDTELESVDMAFNPYTFNIITWKILPESKKPIELNELKNYCPDCGYRLRKTTWCFCPKCGGKI